MSKIKLTGNQGLLYMYDNTAEAYKPIVCATSNSNQSSREQNEDEPTKCNPNSTDFTPGRIDSTYEFEGQSHLVGTTANVSYFEIKQAQLDGIRSFKYVYDAESDVLDQKVDYFQGLVTDVGNQQDVNQVATFSFTVRVRGEISDTDPFEPAI